MLDRSGALQALDRAISEGFRKYRRDAADSEIAAFVAEARDIVLHGMADLDRLSAVLHQKHVRALEHVERAIAAMASGLSSGDIDFGDDDQVRQWLLDPQNDAMEVLGHFPGIGSLLEARAHLLEALPQFAAFEESVSVDRRTPASRSLSVTQARLVSHLARAWWKHIDRDARLPEATSNPDSIILRFMDASLAYLNEETVPAKKAVLNFLLKKVKPDWTRGLDQTEEFDGR